MNDLLLKALRCQPVPRPPVWLMRQAGRYMPQYRELRKHYSLWEMFHLPEVAAKVTRLPLDLLGVDAAILFSDILVIAEALGLQVHFPDKGGPRIEYSGHLEYIPVEEKLDYVFETIRRVKPQINVPLIGFCGGPFTVATYMLDHPRDHSVLQKITDATIAYLQAQVKAGVDVIQIFDSWANLLNDEEFEEYSLRYLNQIMAALKPTHIPIILFCRDSSLRADALSKLQPAGISFDWHVPMHELRKKVPASIAVQGNFDPAFLKLPQEEIVSNVNQLLSSMQGEKGYIVNLGHGVTPDVPIENVRCFIDTVKASL